MDLRTKYVRLVKVAMEEEGVNASQLAEKMGWSRQYMSMLFGGSSVITVNRMEEIAEVLGRGVEVRLVGKPKMEPEASAAAQRGFCAGCGKPSGDEELCGGCLENMLAKV